ncbi:MAG TPA: class II glutamine amidotransferase [Usitatibacter sp.]|nr:class II glutamine amidotransferase [Usitatibacter sp.]
MCRWLAYSGSPIALEEVLFKPSHSLVVQSLKAQKGVETTNGDGFGIGWYGRSPQPRLYRSTSPAWNDRNLRELAAEIHSGLFLAHVRASTGTAVQQTNCHPFRHGNWLWMHNGLIQGFAKVKRELLLAIDAPLFSCIEGTTDSEIMFYLALSMGLAADPPKAVARMVGLVEGVGRRHGIEHPLQMTLAASDGRDLWVFRYSSERRSRSLYYSTDVKTLRKLYPDNPQFRAVSEATRLIVSEPFAELPGAWNEVPECSVGLVRDGVETFQAFEPLSSEAVAAE